jgi:alpha-D-xyloside xylohydrolase
MYGDRYLCCPVLTAGVTKMIVYLPCLAAGEKWKVFSGEETWEGGQKIEIDCFLDIMPVFCRDDCR